MDHADGSRVAAVEEGSGSRSHERCCRVEGLSPSVIENSSCTGPDANCRLKILVLTCCGSLMSGVPVQVSSLLLDRGSKLREKKIWKTATYLFYKLHILGFSEIHVDCKDFICGIDKGLFIIIQKCFFKTKLITKCALCKNLLSPCDPQLLYCF
ncbi:hypothetical protein TNCV_4704302 [Trichonephila clavipes]|nr:hypothetical protein TNCV_4704302 [Trichonephila clavipes]